MSNTFDDCAGLRPLGSLATWSVSSHKYGYGVENLRDPDEDVFWQSEGPQPHSISVQFPHLVPITKISLLLSHIKDDSYTPQTLSIRAGTGKHDLTEVTTVHFDKPEGWQTIDLRESAGSGGGEDDEGEPIHAFLVQITVIANHLNGKDTHIRGLRIWGPETPRLDAAAGEFPFSSATFRMRQALR